MRLASEKFIPGQHCNYCGRSKGEARKEPCPGPYGTYSAQGGRHSWIIYKRKNKV